MIIRILDRAIPLGEEGDAVVLTLKWVRNMLEAVPTQFLVGVVTTAFALYLWDERKRVVEFIEGVRWVIISSTVNLPDAAAMTYDETRAADSLDMGGPRGRTGYHINALFDEAKDGLLHFFAFRPPGTRLVKVPRSRLNTINYRVEDNAIYSNRQDPQVEYNGICVRRKDLRAHIRRWKRSEA